MIYFVAFISAFIIAVVMIPQLKKLAIKIDFVDRPTERKIHKEPVPHLASIGIFFGFMVPYFVVTQHFDAKALALVMGSVLIIGIGIIDDWYKTKGKDFPALPKLVVQVTAAIIVYQSGVVFYGFTNPLTDQYVMLPVALQFLLTVTWIFGVTTVINFMDGLDGLAGSIAAISGTTLFVVALAKGQTDSAMMAIIIVGAVVGYLRFNRQPAQIYMGDAGATFIGFLLAVIALNGAFKQATVLSLFIPVLALGVPIFDSIFVVIKRMREGKKIYIADRSQGHYRLLSAGMNQKQVVLVMSLVNLCLGLVSVIILLLNV